MEQSGPRGRSLLEAVATAVILLGLIILFSIGGQRSFFFLAAAVVLLALFELLDALVRAGRRPNVIFALACGLAMLLAAFFERPVLIAVVLAVATLGAFALALRPGRGDTPTSDVAWTVLALAWIGGGGAAAVSILMLDGGLSLLIAYVLVVACDDIGAYFAGTWFGRHKMAPSISPAKSWEGFAGGFAAAMLGGVVFSWLLRELDLQAGLALGAIAGLLAPVGDVAESLVKRELGIKDSGRLLPGHGGFLDRLDALIFCAPAAFAYLRVFVA